MIKWIVDCHLYCQLQEIIDIPLDYKQLPIDDMLTFNVYITTVDNTPQSPGKEVHSLCTATATSKNLVFVIEHVLNWDLCQIKICVTIIAGSDR